MRRGHSGIDGEASRHYRPKYGTSRLSPPIQFDTHSEKSDSYSYSRGNNYQRLRQNESLQIPSLSKWSQSNRHTSKSPNNFYDNQPDHLNINSMEDVDNRQLQQTSDVYNRIPPLMSLQQPNYLIHQHSGKGHNTYRQERGHRSKSSAASVEYTGHRPPASDHYGCNPTSDIDRSDTFNRSVYDTEDIHNYEYEQNDHMGDDRIDTDHHKNQNYYQYPYHNNFSHEEYSSEDSYGMVNKILGPGTSHSERNSVYSENPKDINTLGGNLDVIGEDISCSPSETPLVSKTTPFKMTRARLSGAGRRRLRKLMADGLTVEEAFPLALLPYKPLPPSCKPTYNENLKRGWSEESPQEQPREEPKPSATFNRRSNPLLSYREFAGSIKVGITDKRPMSTEQMNLIHAAITKTICLEGRRSSHSITAGGPSFLNFSHRPGWLHVICENQTSRDWLVGMMKGCKPWPEAQLSVLNESDLIKPWIASVYVPSLEASNAVDALCMISYQNGGLSTEHWRVVKEIRQDGGFIAFYSLDYDSVKTLREYGCRASIGMRKLMFRIKRQRTKVPIETSGAIAGLSELGNRSTDGSETAACGPLEEIAIPPRPKKKRVKAPKKTPTERGRLSPQSEGVFCPVP